MANISLPVLAGTISTTVFACSLLPMLVKAARTRDLSSYSIGNLVLANVGNAVHSLYVFHLPPGPIWFLHTFYLLTSALMLAWWVRFRPGTGTGDAAADVMTPTGAADAVSARNAVGRSGAASSSSTRARSRRRDGPGHLPVPRSPTVRRHPAQVTPGAVRASQE